MSDATDDSEWVSWAQAARLIGLPVHRVEWWKRQGRIEHRAEDKMRPTLRRTSVEEFGRWYHAREAERLARRETKRAQGRDERTPPMPSGYLSSVEAAARAGLSSKTVIKRAQPLGATQRGRQWWIPAEAVNEIRRQLRRERAEADRDAISWVSLCDAAKIIGCDDNTVLTYVKRGAIEQRSVPRNQPSLSRRSVESFASRWRPRRGFGET